MKKIYPLILSLLLMAPEMNAATKTWNGGTGIGKDWTANGNWNPAGAPAAGDDIIFNTAGAIGFSTLPASIAYNSLTISQGDITLAGSNITITLGGAAGTDLSIASGATLILTNASITLAANATADISGTITINNGRTYNTNGTSVVSTVTGNIVNNNAIVTCTTASKLLMQGNSVYTHNLNAGTIPTATWNSNSTCNITGVTTTIPDGNTQAFGNFTWNCGAQTANVAFGGVFAFAGNLTISNTGTGRLELGATGNTARNLILDGGTFMLGSNQTRSLSLMFSVTINGGTLLMTSANSDGILNVPLSFSFNPGGTITETGTNGKGYINFSGTGIQLFSSGGTVTNDINWTVNSGAKLEMSDENTVMTGNTFTLTNGGTLYITSANGIAASGATGNIQTTTRTFNSGANYGYYGPIDQVTGTGLPSAVNDLYIDNLATQVSLTNPVTVNGILLLGQGILKADPNELMVSATGSTAGGSNASFVEGPMSKIGSTAFTFPVGKIGAGLRTIGVSGLSGSLTFTAEFFRAGSPNAGNLGAGLTQVSSCEYWILNRAGASGSASVTLSWEANSYCGGVGGFYVTDLPTLRVGRYDGSNWVEEGNSSTSGNATAGTITSIPVSSFSPFALGSSSAATNPLPVKFGPFRAYEKQNGIQLEWKVYTEDKVKEYVIERAADARSFHGIGTTPAVFNTVGSGDYGFFDSDPLAGRSFYRLKNVDIDGKSSYSPVIMVNRDKSVKGLGLYPNPVNNGVVVIQGSDLQKGKYKISILTLSGQEVYSQVISHPGGTISQTIELPSSLQKSSYIFILKDEKGRNVFNQKLLN